jgi:DNA processing protein
VTDRPAAFRRDWLRLARTSSVGAVTFRELMRRYGDPSLALEALPDLARRAGRVSPLSPFSATQAEDEIAAGEALGAQLLLACDPGFPEPLAALDPPPPLVWVLGDARPLERTCVAVVGARAASALGLRFAGTLAADLGAAGLTVVSGLARGVDGAAHQGSLATGTAAVLAGGVDDVYPPQHADLYRAILDSGGCTVSENPPGRTASAADFPRRNRIIAGLSRAVVVVEAELRSGSLITARLAAEMGREVLAVPGSPLDPRSRGGNDLLRQGAAVCEGAEDVLRALAGLAGLAEPGLEFEPAPPKGADAAAEAPESARQRLLSLLSPSPAPRDEIVRLSGLSTAEVNAALAELELAGHVVFTAGGGAALA